MLAIGESMKWSGCYYLEILNSLGFKQVNRSHSKGAHIVSWRGCFTVRHCEQCTTDQLISRDPPPAVTEIEMH